MKRAILSAVLIVYGVVLAESACKNFATLDEPAFVASGIAHWETGQYAPYRVNPPLPRMIATFPLYMDGVAFQELTTAAYNDVPVERPEWHMGDILVQRLGPTFFQHLRLARLAGILWAIAGAYTIYRWSGELYGPRAAWLGLALWCAEPNILGHAALVTADVPAGASAIVATYLFWTYLRAPTWNRAVASGLLLGMCELTKFTMILWYLVWPVLWIAYRYARRTGAQGTGVSIRREVAQGAAMGVASLVVINIGYECKETCRQLNDYSFASRLFTADASDPSVKTWGNRFHGTFIGRLIVPLPADYLRGIDVQRWDFERIGKRMPSYLHGEWRDGGWWYYYLYALAVKVPLPIWALVLWSVVLTLVRHPSSAPWRDELVLWLPALAVLILVSSQTGFNHHLRYVLPLFPFVAVSTAKLGYFLTAGRWRVGVGVVALIVVGVINTLSVRPHYLSYFNELAGGPDNGHKHLLNSNIDWGQDLLFLKDWIEEHPEARPLGLAYFNMVDPAIAGIEYTLPPYGTAPATTTDTDASLRLGPHPGYYAVSVNHLYGFPFGVPDGKGGRAGGQRGAFEYFQHFQPIAKAGYSIFIYHIDYDECNRVRSELGLPPLPEPAQP